MLNKNIGNEYKNEYNQYNLRSYHTDHIGRPYFTMLHLQILNSQ